MEENLHLVLRGKHFNAILAGEQDTEKREIRPKNQHIYLSFDKDGKFIDVKRYKKLTLYLGYEKGRPSIEVEVKGIALEFLEDEEGNPLTFMHEGEEYDYTNIVYSLGNIINKHNC